MVLQIDNITTDNKSELLNLLDKLNINYKLFDNSWDCYVTDEMNTSVPIYYKDADSKFLNNLIEDCIDVAIADQDALLSGDTLYNFIESVSESVSDNVLRSE